jgi:hypothetical protein
LQSTRADREEKLKEEILDVNFYSPSLQDSSGALEDIFLLVFNDASMVGSSPVSGS